MNEDTVDPRVDRLYRLLPRVYRMRDADQQYALQALLRVVAEQVNVVEDDIARLYEDWFVETADEWAVPYIGDLVGYRPVADAGQFGDGATEAGRARNRLLVPRREVANTIRYRRRKGTLALLEQLANDVAGWPARAVEFFTLLNRTQNIDHLHLDRGRVADLRDVDALDLLDGPFDRVGHTVDVRTPGSHRTSGRTNIPSVGVFVWRLGSYPVTHTSSYCVEEAGPHCNTFSALGQDTQLFVRPEPEADASQIAEEMTVPSPIRRLALERHLERYYGEDKSLVIWADGWSGRDPREPVPASAIVAADLSDWQYVPPRDRIAVDPVLGRFSFHPSQLPKRSVRVGYHYGFSAPVGGGEYERARFDPSPRKVKTADPDDPAKTLLVDSTAKLYRVGRDQTYTSIAEALRHWKADDPWDAVIELTESRVYSEPLAISLGENRTLVVRAANRIRPILRLLDWSADMPDSLAVAMGRGSRFTLDGLMITGRGLHVSGPVREVQSDARAPICSARLTIRHCTLVPGWALDGDCRPKRPAEPSLELYGVRAEVRVEHSILGSIEINEDEVGLDPIPIAIADSVVDATSSRREAIGAPGYPAAHAVLDIRRSTVFGIVDVHAIRVAENCIFYDCVNAARRQLGCMRFCYVPPGCRTPRRYSCQPDLVERAVVESTSDVAVRVAKIAAERLRVRPQFTATRYGTSGYCQLSTDCADEIKQGAEDESEMGVFHDLYQTQREANLRARLGEYTPAGTDVGIIHAT